MKHNEQSLTDQKGIGRRNFIKATGLTTAAVSLGLISRPGSARAQAAAASTSAAAKKPVITGITSITDPISKAKSPFPMDYVKAARERFSFPNWQAGGDDSVYYNMHIPEFLNCGIAVPVMETRELKRKINRHLDDLTFKAKDGSTTPKLKDYLTGPKRVQAMIMAHKGRVVFEAYPGMNPTDMHIWMSASKTACGLMVMYLEADGKVDMEKPITAYATQLKGTAWDKVSLKNAMNMATGLDVEESFANLVNPKSYIAKFFTAMMSTGAAGDWIQVVREAEPLPGEPAGSHMRYSTSITQVLALVVENVSNLTYMDYFQKRVWSKLGVKDPFLVTLLADKTPLAGGGNFTAIEDFLRYAMIYTPSWKVVSEERIVSEALLKRIQTLGDPKAFAGCTEQQYGHEWFGEPAERNSAQWDDVFADGAMFKHGNMGQGIYVDPARDFCGVHFASGPNEGGIDWSPGYHRAAAKMLAGK